MKRLLSTGIILLFIGMSISSSTGFNLEKESIIPLFSRGYIQDLIDNASAGDTIYIPSGKYYENITINKSITLIGEDKNTTWIIGSILISEDWVSVSGFTFDGDIENHWIIVSNNNTIYGNKIGDNLFLNASNGNNIIGRSRPKLRFVL